MKKIFLILLIMSGCKLLPINRNIITLEGEWEFKIDSLDQGIEERWYMMPLDETVNLPGSMAENGKGEEVSVSTDWTGSIVDRSWFTDQKYARYREPGNIKIPFWLKPVKYYKGPAWYRQDIMIPLYWQGKRIFLHLERCHWESTFFVDNHKVGTQNSLATPHDYDLTPYLNPGMHSIAIRIDNRLVIPVGQNSHSVSDHTQSNWNGIIGRIFLKAVPHVCLNDIQIYPDIENKLAQISISVSNPELEKFQGMIEIQAESFNSRTRHQADKLTEPVSITESETTIEVSYPMGENVQFWNEFDPVLYHLTVTLVNDRKKPFDQKVVDFGMREFKADGSRFELNGHPVFLRGTLECCIFPLTGYPPTDVGSWEHVFNRCKEYGLNHIRFHSWCPPEAAFTAADKLGFYLQVECSSWANGETSLGNGLPIDDFIYQEGDRILKEYGNHPSFCMMAYGNEPGGRYQRRYLAGLLRYWKAKDPRRVYTSAAGWPIMDENDYHNGPQPRIQQWGAELNSIINAEPPQTVFDYRDIITQYEVPFVSHEIGQWCVYPDFKEIPKYTGVLKATNFEIFKETLDENHMGDQAEQFLMASGKLQAICYKADIEAALRTPGFAGFQLLQLHDFPGQGTAPVGVLNAFFESKGYISPKEFRQFCSQTVPLARLEKRIFTNTEMFGAKLEIAHFGKDTLSDITVNWDVTNTAGNIIASGKYVKDLIPFDNCIPVGTITFPLQDTKAAHKFTLRVKIARTSFANQWDFWVYPSAPDMVAYRDVYITNSLEQTAGETLNRGGSVLLLCHGKIREDHGARVITGFSSIFWNTAWTGGQAPHTLGILCDPDQPVFSEFPTEFHSNWQWWDPLSNAQVMILDAFPPTLHPLIQPIDTWFENRRLALAFEAKVGEGKLLVCSIDLENDLEKRPVSRQLKHSILNYMSSESFNPANEVDIETIKDLLIR